MREWEGGSNELIAFTNGKLNLLWMTNGIEAVSLPRLFAGFFSSRHLLFFPKTYLICCSPFFVCFLSKCLCLWKSLRNLLSLFSFLKTLMEQCPFKLCDFFQFHVSKKSQKAVYSTTFYPHIPAQKSGKTKSNRIDETHNYLPAVQLIDKILTYDNTSFPTYWLLQCLTEYYWASFYLSSKINYCVSNQQYFSENMVCNSWRLRINFCGIKYTIIDRYV